MKKLIISSLIAMFCASAGATTMCATDDTLAIVLDPLINGTAASHNTDLFEWSATFSYGTVWGIATCVDTSVAPNTAVEELRDSNGEIVTGGERTGRYCWCQLSHPAKSRWVFRNAYSSVALRVELRELLRYLRPGQLCVPRGPVRVARLLEEW